ncbi:hypothetical protein HY522_12665 [bacterium]|nr:hypothetical protein [bacterium]
MKRTSTKKTPLAVLGEEALKKAVYDAIRDHARTGDKVVIYRQGRVEEVPAARLMKRRGIRE